MYSNYVTTNLSFAFLTIERLSPTKAKTKVNSGKLMFYHQKIRCHYNLNYCTICNYSSVLLNHIHNNPPLQVHMCVAQHMVIEVGIDP